MNVKKILLQKNKSEVFDKINPKKFHSQEEKELVLELMVDTCIKLFPKFFESRKLFFLSSIKKNPECKYAQVLLKQFKILKEMRDEEGATDPMEIVVDDFIRCVYARAKRSKVPFHAGFFTNIATNMNEWEKFLQKDLEDTGEPYWSHDGRTYEEIMKAADELFEKVTRPMEVIPCDIEYEIREMSFKQKD